jgi:hypothetical protein
VYILKKIDSDFILVQLIKIGTPLIIATYALKWFYGFAKQGVIKNDFIFFWTASSLAASGRAQDVYDFTLFQNYLEKVAMEPMAEAFFYPPTFLLLLFPLSFMPFILSFSIWISVTLVSYYYVVHRIAPHSFTILMVLAFSPTLLNIGYGHNGFLTAALMGGGLLVADRRPIVGGVLLGLLTYKPNLAILLPFALIAGRKWRVLVAFVISAGLMVLLSCFMFGFDIWAAFIHNAPASAKVLESGFNGFILNYKTMPSPYAAVRLAGGSAGLSFLAQITATALALFITVWVWSREASLPLRASILVICSMLFTPYLQDYDVTLLALAIAWLGWEGYLRKWPAKEKLFLLAMWFAPLVSLMMVRLFNMQILPVFFVIVIIFLLRRDGFQKKPI